MIRGEFKRLSSKAGSKQTSFSDTSKKPQTADDTEETIGQKMKKLAQAWKDIYKTSGYSAEAHNPLPLRAARTYCKGAGAALNDRGATIN